MSQNAISPDDPRLTAYAFNEMAATERREFEQLLQQDAAARQVVEEIRATGAMLSAVLEDEPAGMSAEKLAAAGPGSGPAGAQEGRDARHAESKRLIAFPQFYYVVSGLAAACFAVFFAYWQSNQPTRAKYKHYTEISLSGGPEAAIEPAPAPAAPAPEIVLSAPQDNSLRAMVERSARAERDQRAGERAAAQAHAELEARAASADVSAHGYLDAAPRRRQGAAASTQFAARLAKASGGEPRPWQSAPSFAAPMTGSRLPESEANTEAYRFQKENDFLRVADQPLSTFSIDVDTASYANVRRFLEQGERPPVDAVRIEEMLNYFPYDYRSPTGDVPFAAHLEVASAPWAPEHRLVRIGLKGREISEAARPAANLVFLIDVSGSMLAPNKLPLVKQSLRLLVEKLRPTDRVALAVYAGASGLALPSTPVSKKAEILAAIDQLEAAGSTNGALGIQLAYDVAKANFIPHGVNRVLLATDGDFNVGTTSEGELVRLIQEKAQSGVFLSVLGFGMGNYQDATLEQLANKGNGNYAYIDSLAEAKKSLVEQAGGTLVTIAKDVKIQVEFNPAEVRAYRLIGYENRLLANYDFNNDKIDAGEIGAGHTVTALYEVVPARAELPEVAPAMDELKYQRPVGGNANAPKSVAGELLTVKIRYKAPAGDESRKLEFPLRDGGTDFEAASPDFKFATAVAGFGMMLRDSSHKGSTTLTEVARWGRAGVSSDPGGYRNEFLGLVERAQSLMQ